MQRLQFKCFPYFAKSQCMRIKVEIVAQRTRKRQRVNFLSKSNLKLTTDLKNENKDHLT